MLRIASAGPGWRCARALAAGFLQLFTACLVESDKRCDANQVEVTGQGRDYCACAPGFVIDDDNVGCKACAENETSEANMCVCLEGYVRASPSDPCAMSSLGAPCESDTNCAGDFPACVSDDRGGYCSSRGCQSSSDCQPNWYCQRDAGESTCRKPPEGYREPCSGPADCAGTSATFCDSFQSRSCLIEGCGVGTPCPGDWSCCRIAVISVSLCIEPSGLMQGNCPAGGTLVMP